MIKLQEQSVRWQFLCLKKYVEQKGPSEVCSLSCTHCFPLIKLLSILPDEKISYTIYYHYKEKCHWLPDKTINAHLFLVYQVLYLLYAKDLPQCSTDRSKNCQLPHYQILQISITIKRHKISCQTHMQTSVISQIRRITRHVIYTHTDIIQEI